MPKSLVIFSGGQDSTTCLFMALKRGDEVRTIGFSYGQRHGAELRCRQRILNAIRAQFPDLASRLGEDTLAELPAIGALAPSALTSSAPIEERPGSLPTSFVPGRNLAFICHAAAHAYGLGIHNLILGVGQADSSGYPDCTAPAMAAMQEAISLGIGTPFTIEAPLMSLSKAQTWELAEAVGGAALVRLILEETHTCYLGDRSARHDWGYGCGACPACRLRERGWREYLSRRGGSPL
ncbi:MAG: 7-cyano-7-deazaguanine synthase QueC [Succinivibrionaceae bacterium]|nr:7-cyano-7-deazaguanine synthase QueC [Succinivibrionaceae bacterium]